MDKAYPSPIAAPASIDGKPAPVLHEGSMEEAGMEADAPERIDKVLQAWAADSDQGFVALVARHGVIVLHKAYGMRDGKPMTTDTRSWMASNTKTLAALLMMMLMDKGLVSLDDPVTKFLPAMRGIKVSTPMTIRQLYTHTCGFPVMEHWGDELHDLDEVVADMYPFLTLGRTYAYNGVGYALGGKVIEAVSGECLPDFYRRHLLDPLGCANTEVTGTSYDAESVALDMGRIAQMMLNGGAYGDKRFLSRETLSRMLPYRLDKFAPKGVKMTNPEVIYGIGLSPYDDEGLGKGTFGHGAASGATLRIDPVNDLIITMTRNDLGSNYVAYHQKFIDAVTAGIRKAATPGRQ